MTNSNPDNVVSKENFDTVYQYIFDQIKKDTTKFYSYKNYDFYLKEESEILVKKDTYIISHISRENGIRSLAKREKDNKELVKKTTQLFLELLLIADKASQ